MKPTNNSLADGESASGSVNQVTRSGDVVLRPMGHWSSSVHELLRYLENTGFEYAPRYFGVDSNSQRERLSYLEGEVALRPWPEVLRSVDGLEQIAGMLKKYHQVVTNFEPSIGHWHLSDREVPASPIIRHGDIGPWNMVWDGNRLVGMIDWDFAESGTILEDLAQTAWHCIPLKPPKRLSKTGDLSESQEKRFDHFCNAYGVSKEAVLKCLPDVQNLEVVRMRTHGARGIEPWKTFLERGDAEIVQEDSEWLGQNMDTLNQPQIL